MKPLHLLSALLLLTASTLAAQAEIYKTVDADGNVEYSDKPASEDAETVTLPKVNTAPPTRITVKLSPPEAEQTEDKKAQEPEAYTITLQSPANESTVTMGQMTVSSSVAISPALSADHSVQFYLDGIASGEPTQATSHTFGELYRGAHKIHAAILNKKGKVLKKSKSVTIYVHRAKVPRLGIQPLPR